MDQKTDEPFKGEPLKTVKRVKKGKAAKKSGLRAKKSKAASGGASKYPRHSVEKALRIPRAIIDQNAGKPCTERESAKYVGVGFNGPYRVEVSSSIKYGFLTRPQAGIVEVTERARQAIRPQKPGDDIEALRKAVLAAPDISEVYVHYRGSTCPMAHSSSTHSSISSRYLPTR